MLLTTQVAGDRRGPISAARALAAAGARRLAAPWPLAPCPGWRFAVPVQPGPRATARRVVGRACRQFGIDLEVDLPWVLGLRIPARLRSDVGRCLYVAGSYEPNELAMVARVVAPTDTVIDVGANDGLFTLVLSRLVGRGGTVVAVEPSSRERGRLLQNLAANGCANVVVHPEALADEDGWRMLQVADDGHTGQNTFGAFVYDGVHRAGTQPVAATTLDRIAHGAASVALVKVDVEGAEVAVLRGAQRTLSRHRPVLLVESNDLALRAQGSSARELAATLVTSGHRLFSFAASTGLPVEMAADAVVLDGNVVAVPQAAPEDVVRRVTGAASARCPLSRW